MQGLPDGASLGAGLRLVGVRGDGGTSGGSGRRSQRSPGPERREGGPTSGQPHFGRGDARDGEGPGPRGEGQSLSSFFFTFCFCLVYIICVLYTAHACLDG